jgi:hypothetical protein
VLLAASASQSHGLGWVDWITVIGLPLTLLGLYLTWSQARKATSAAAAARKAVSRTEQQLRANQLLVLVPQLRWTVNELDSAIQGKDSMLVQRELNSWRWQAQNIHGILSGTGSSEKEILTRLQQSVVLAQTAGEKLLLGGMPVADGCRKARRAIAAACDELTAWAGRHSTQAMAGREES